MRKIFYLKEDLERSASPEVIKEDLAIVRKAFGMYGDIVDIKISGILENDGGVDYTVIYADGREIKIDVKRRNPGCSKFWKKGEPEFQIEIYTNILTRHIGWSIDRTKKTDYIIYVFDRSDHNKFYVFSRKLMVDVVMKNGRKWYNKFFHAKQTNKNGNYVWDALCMFVPASVFIKAMNEFDAVAA